LCNTALSLDYYKRAQTIRERHIIEFPRLVASAVNNIGALLNIMGLHNEAAANCSRAQMLYEIRDINDRNINPKEDTSAYLTLEMAEVLQNLGCIYYSMKNYEYSKKFYLEALDITRKLGGENESVAEIYFNMGGVYMAAHEYTEALNWLKKAIIIYQAYKDTYKICTDSLAIAHKKIGDLYEVLQKNEEALTHYNLALNLFIEVYGSRNNTEVANILISQGTLYTDLYYVQAMDSLKEALYIYQLNIHDKDKIPVTYACLGYLCHRHKKFDDARNYYEKALASAEGVFLSDDPFIEEMKHCIENVRQTSTFTLKNFMKRFH